MGFEKPNNVEQKYVKKYDVFNNMEHRRMIKEFEKNYGCMGFFPALLKLGAAKITVQHPEGAINEVLIEEVNDVMDKFKACNDLIALGEYADEKEQMRFPNGATFDPVKASKNGLEEMMKGVAKYMASDKYKGSPETYNLMDKLERGWKAQTA